MYTHIIVLQLSPASNDLYHTIDLPIVSPVVFLPQPGPNFQRRTNFPPKIFQDQNSGDRSSMVLVALEYLELFDVLVLQVAIQCLSQEK